MRHKLVWSLACAVLAWAGTAQGSILTFDIQGAYQYMPIPGAYGDHIGSLNSGAFSYGAGTDLTPNIGIAYRSLDPVTGVTTSPDISYWDVRYANLVNVAYPTHPGDMGEISLIPDPGWKVRLNSFDLAGYWPNGPDYPDQPLRILDSAGNVLADYSPLYVSGTEVLTITPNLEVEGTIRIQFGANWNIGITNVSFDQVRSNPEPGSLILLGVGILGLLGYGWRRYRRVA
jgi:hypothetical protein